MAFGLTISIVASRKCGPAALHKLRNVMTPLEEGERRTKVGVGCYAIQTAAGCEECPARGCACRFDTIHAPI